MDCEWDPNKAASNFEKHGISFDAAATIFSDPLALTFNGPGHSQGEYQYLSFSVSPTGRPLVVAQADRGDTIRILSARPMTASERRDYEQQ